MSTFLLFTILGLVTGATYAIAASGLVVTYTTSGIFNFAHGAIGMFMAFTFWQLTQAWGWPALPSLLFVVLVLAPLFGALIERLLMRGLAGASATTTMVVTVGLMVALIGFAQWIWPSSTQRQLPPFFGAAKVNLFGAYVTDHQLLTMGVAVAVAIGLRFLLFRTRIGTAMRAVVDDRNLVSLNGGRPGQISMLSWAIGSSLAAVAGILLAPQLQLDPIILTLLVVSAYAAAMVGRLTSLPLTFAGAIGLGLLQSWLSWGGVEIHSTAVANFFADVGPSLPTFLLFAVLLLMPEGRLRTARLATGSSPRVPSLRQSAVAGVVFVIGAAVLVQFLQTSDVLNLGGGLALGLIMLSLVLLVGYGGQPSLCQMSFAGIGAFAMASFGHGSPVGFVMAVIIAAPIGALVALPAMRLQGLYLALATFAFAVLMDNLIFPRLFGNLSSKSVARPHFLWFTFDSERAMFVLLAVAFALVGMLVLAMRRGRFGRRLAAMRDSPAATTMLGISIPVTKLVVFTISAALAGFAGALYGSLRGAAGPTDFLAFQSLPVLLLAMIGGVTTVTGALLGGLLFAVHSYIPGSLAPVFYLGTGASAVLLGRNSNGIAGEIFDRVERLAFWRRPGGVEPMPSLIREEVSPVGVARG